MGDVDLKIAHGKSSPIWRLPRENKWGPIFGVPRTGDGVYALPQLHSPPGNGWGTEGLLVVEKVLNPLEQSMLPCTGESDTRWQSPHDRGKPRP